MKRNPWNLAIFLALAAASPTRADFLTLTTNENLTWSSLANPSPTFTVGINNPSSTQHPLLAWSLGLTIKAEAGAVGQVTFASASIPSNYLLANRSDGIQLPLGFTFPSSSISTIGDDDSMGVGVIVPTGSVNNSGANLLALAFKMTAGTHGVFDILTNGDPTDGSYWISGDSGNQNYPAQDFANVPFGPSEVLLGTLTIPGPMTAVPEPSSALLGLLAAGPMAWLARRGRPSASPADPA